MENKIEDLIEYWEYKKKQLNKMINRHKSEEGSCPIALARMIGSLSMAGAMLTELKRTMKL